MAITNYLFSVPSSRLKGQQIGLFLLLCLMLGSCTQTTESKSDKSEPNKSTDSKVTDSPASTGKTPLVVATTDVLCNLVKTIAKETVELKCLVAAGTDPHTYAVTPADRQAIETASLLLYAGYDFEPTIIKAIKATKNTTTKVAINELAVTEPLQMVEDGKTETDPHVWHDAQNGIKIVAALESALTKAIPAQATTYAANAKTLTTELTQIDTWIKTQIGTIPVKSRKLVTTHDALGYYGKAYGIPIEGALQGLSTEEKPTPARVKKLVTEIRASGVPTVFAEASNSSKLLTSVAAEAKVKIYPNPLFADGLGETGSTGDTYPKMLISNTQVITEGLGGKFQAFAAK
jgi:manganese/iron transport system substrate-binding protein